MPKIYKSNEAMLAKTLIGLIYGDSGCGKTTVVGTSHAALILDSDHGAYRALNRPDTLEVRSWHDIIDVVDDDAIMAEYETIIVDTVGTALDFLIERVVKLPGKNSNGVGGLSPQGWGVLKTEFQSFVNKLRTKDKNVLFVAHAREEKDGETRYYRPDIQGGSKDMLYRLCDYIGYAYRTNTTTRVIDFACVERAVVKDSANIGMVTIPDLTYAQPYFARLTTQMLDNINSKTSAQQQAVSRIAAFRTTAESLTELEEFNSQVQMLLSLLDHDRAVAIQCKLILDQRARSLHFVYSTDTRTYIAETSTTLSEGLPSDETVYSFETVSEFNQALQQARSIAKHDKAEGKRIKSLLDTAAGECGFVYDAPSRQYILPETAEVEEEESVW
jgi:energy-coupling factor transporter ATP-binding protein EcfA2